uniref:Virion infectivity factor n=1 Tax=Simian immunodeficiency virus TaxID=11723 RepID=A0A1P8NRR4_SIV|nr:vif protein [Simian immunodeficiency virus]
MEKEWITVLIWRISPRQMDRLMHCCKVHMYKSKHLQKAEYKHHYQIEWEWWTRAQFEIPIGQGKLVIKIYHNLTPERGLLREEGVGLIWVYQKPTKSCWIAEVTPTEADRLIHNYYFPCFTDSAVRQAIRGEQLTSHCWTPHVGQVPLLQYLALKAYLGYHGPGFLQSIPASARGTTVLHSKKCQLGRTRGNKCHCQGRNGSTRSMQAFHGSRNIWSLVSMLGGRSRARGNSNNGLD